MPQISAVMDKFEQQFEDLDVQSSYMENAMGSTTATATPQDEVDLLMQKVADEAGLEMNASLSSASAPVRVGANEVEEERLGERLRALRG
jgi:charged multivesicular body protein 1